MNLFKVKVLELRDTASQLMAYLKLVEHGEAVIASRVESNGGKATRFVAVDEFLVKRTQILQGNLPLGIGENDILHPPEASSDKYWKVMYSILKGIALQQPLDPADLETFTVYLNVPVIAARIHTSPAIKVNLDIGFTRIVGEQFLRYVGLLDTDPRLSQFNPIALCPTCEALFIKKKVRQECCSKDCYFKKWSAEKLTAEPRYFADKAAESRKVKKAQRTARKNTGKT